MGFFKKTFKKIAGGGLLAKPVSRQAGKIAGNTIGQFMQGFAGDQAQAEQEVEDNLAETEEDKKRRLAAMSSLNPTGSLGAGSAQIKRPGVTGVAG